MIFSFVTVLVAWTVREFHTWPYKAVLTTLSSLIATVSPMWSLHPVRAVANSIIRLAVIFWWCRRTLHPVPNSHTIVGFKLGFYVGITLRTSFNIQSLLMVYQNWQPSMITAARDTGAASLVLTHRLPAGARNSQWFFMAFTFVNDFAATWILNVCRSRARQGRLRNPMSYIDVLIITRIITSFKNSTKTVNGKNTLKLVEYTERLTLSGRRSILVLFGIKNFHQTVSYNRGGNMSPELINLNKRVIKSFMKRSIQAICSQKLARWNERSPFWVNFHQAVSRNLLEKLVLK